MAADLNSISSVNTAAVVACASPQIEEGYDEKSPWMDVVEFDFVSWRLDC